jgi:hypothetical protein
LLPLIVAVPLAVWTIVPGGTLTESPDANVKVMPLKGNANVAEVTGVVVVGVTTDVVVEDVGDVVEMMAELLPPPHATKPEIAAELKNSRKSVRIKLLRSPIIILAYPLS